MHLVATKRTPIESLLSSRGRVSFGFELAKLSGFPLLTHDQTGAGEQSFLSWSFYIVVPRAQMNLSPGACRPPATHREVAPGVVLILPRKSGIFAPFFSVKVVPEGDKPSDLVLLMSAAFRLLYHSRGRAALSGAYPGALIRRAARRSENEPNWIEKLLKGREKKI